VSINIIKPVNRALTLTSDRIEIGMLGDLSHIYYNSLSGFFYGYDQQIIRYI
jgi:hypothetical protein